MMPGMSVSTLAFLAIRVLHVLLAALWVGATGFIVFFLMPAVTQAGPAAAPVIGAIARRGLNAFMGAVGGITVLSGFYLYYRLTGGFDPSLSATRGAMVFGTGGILGLAGLIIGGSLVGRNGQLMGKLAGQAASLPEGAERAALMTRAATARARATTWGRILLVLQLVALACMALGHYI
jgi:uncharacterized membrane protein